MPRASMTVPPSGRGSGLSDSGIPEVSHTLFVSGHFQSLACSLVALEPFSGLPRGPNVSAKSEIARVTESERSIDKLTGQGKR